MMSEFVGVAATAAVPANAPIRLWATLYQSIHVPCRGGWFSKCQDLCFLVLTQGARSGTTQQMAACLWAGPEALEPQVRVA